MTDLLNQKVKTSFNKEQDRALVAGMYGFNETDGKWNYAQVDSNGDLKVNIHATGGGGDLKARTDIADPATSTFLKCNADGTLEMTAELSTAGLATSAIQTDGTQKTQILGNTEADGTGTATHIHTDATGNVLSQVVNTISIQPSNDTNSKLTDDPTKSVAVGLKGRQTISSAATETFIKCNASGALAVEVATNTAEIKAEDDTGSARNVRCNNSGHIKSACIGAESDGTLRQVQTNEVGQLKTKLVADDGATRREVRCDANGKLSVVDGETTQTPHTLFSGSQVIAASNSFSFDSAGATAILDVDGLTKATFVVVGSGTSTSLEVSEMIGDTNSTLATNISSTKFMTGLQNFSFSTDSVGRYRGLHIANLSSNSYTITSIKVVYNQ